MKNTKKKVETVENRETAPKLYYFEHNFWDKKENKHYIAGQGYELTLEQVADFIRYVDIGNCPKISKKDEDCGCT